VATNQMRREAAKRKLERQQERRAQQAKRRRQVAVITSAAVVVLVLVGVVLAGTLGGGTDETRDAAAGAQAAAPGAPEGCDYLPGGPAAKPVETPPTDDVATEGTVPVTIATSAGAVPVTLDRAAAPCTVNSFVSLAQQGYFDATPCHRLTGGGSLSVLQCGDPTGTGSGGPGYSFADETNPGMTYPRGTLAMANAGPDTNGSQFFMVYADSQLPPDYTVFGSIGEEGLAVLDGIAAAGAEGGATDGAPAQPVTIETATVG
jgi:peptidyl-prolyl cis-trans isomerase B (cyclophilin B)